MGLFNRKRGTPRREVPSRPDSTAPQTAQRPGPDPLHPMLHRRLPLIKTQADIDRAMRAKTRPSASELRIVSEALAPGATGSNAEQARIMKAAESIVSELAVLSETELAAVHPNTGKGFLLDSMAAAGAGVLSEYGTYLSQGKRSGHEDLVLEASYAASETFYTLLGGFQA
jgi:hypothetical protein